MMQALVLLTFATSLNTNGIVQHHSNQQKCACCTAVPNADYAVFTEGGQIMSGSPGLMSEKWVLCKDV